MNFLEKDLETIIYDSNKKKLEERGLRLTGKLIRQLRIGNYGISDLVEVNSDYLNGYRYLDINVIEIKKDEINLNTFLQALGYAKGIQKYLEDVRDFYRYTLRITLIGRLLDKSNNFLYLTDLINSNTPDLGSINSVSYYTYSYELEGLKFTGEYGYYLTNDGFKDNKKVDITKPQF